MLFSVFWDREAIVVQEPVIYLRRFKGLRSLSLAGNPLCTDERYEQFVIAMLSLKYLDFRRVAEETVWGYGCRYKITLLKNSCLLWARPRHLLRSAVSFVFSLPLSSIALVSLSLSCRQRDVALVRFQDRLEVVAAKVCSDVSVCVLCLCVIDPFALVIISFISVHVWTDRPQCILSGFIVYIYNHVFHDLI